MRWLIAAVLFLVATSGFAQQNDAERLYRSMESKIKNAKAIKISWSEFNGAGGKTAKSKGTAYLADGNKAFFESVWVGQDGLPSATLVSDGNTMVTKVNNNVAGRPVPSKNIGSSIANLISPMGTAFLSVGIPEIEKAPEMFEKIGISAFKLAGKETILGKESQIVEFEIGDKKAGGGKTMNAKIWIDTRTMTPMKREMFDPANPKDNFMNETYTEFIIDPQLDPKMFELPK